MGSEDPVEIINAETNRMPFKHNTPLVTDWHQCFKSWPTDLKGWTDWYNRVAAAKSANWEELDIAHAIGLSVLDIKRREPQLSACGYFWSDTLNAFIFSHGSQQINLLDVDQLTGLDITTSPNPCSI